VLRSLVREGQFPDTNICPEPRATFGSCRRPSCSRRPARCFGEVVDPAGLAERAAEVAARQRSPETRRTYAAVYRTFGAVLGPHPTSEDMTAEAVRAYRDQLERAGRSPATVAKHLSALRAEALGADAQLRTVRSARVGRGEPRALSHDEWTRLLRIPAPARASATSRCCISHRPCWAAR
jgi:integrase